MNNQRKYTEKKCSISFYFDVYRQQKIICLKINSLPQIDISLLFTLYVSILKKKPWRLINQMKIMIELYVKKNI